VGPEKRDMLGKLQWLDYVERDEKLLSMYRELKWIRKEARV